MRRLSRFRRIAKWVGTILGIALLGLWGVSYTRNYSWFAYPERVDDFYICMIRDGQLRITHCWSQPLVEPVPALEDMLHPGPQVKPVFQMSLGVPLLLFAVPTALLWWLDRRRSPPGHCRRCGYNLTGNVSGKCPECGKAI